jgi:hypothetical protein
MHPEVERDALLATHGGLRWERWAVRSQLAPMARDRRLCALGPHGLVTVRTRCGLARPVYCLAAAQHTPGLTHKAYLPTMVSGRVLWPLGYAAEARAAAFTQSSGAFQRAAVQPEPLSRVKGVLTEGFDSTTKRLRTRFPGVCLGHCLRHALPKLPGQLTAIASPVRKAVRTPFHTLLYRARQRQGWRVLALGQR